MKLKMIMKELLRQALLLATFGLAAFNSSAATRIWDGGGTNGLWEAVANWSNNVAVANGDQVIFPGSAAQHTSTNRASGNITNVSAVRFTGGGYTLFSSPLRLNSGLSNANTAVSPNTINAVLRPLTSQTWSVAGRTSLTLNSNITVPTTALTLTLDLAGTLTLNGSLLGTGGLDVTKRGFGELELNGTNNVVSDFSVTAGELTVNGSLDSFLVISTNALLQGRGSLASPVTCFGEVRPGGAGAGILDFRTVNSPELQPGARLVVDINGPVPGVDYDQLRSVSIFKLTGSQLVLRLSPSFPFAPGQKFVIIANTSSTLGFNTTFANLPQNALITNNGVVFQISYAGGTGNDVELTVVDTPFAPTGVTRVWDGGAGVGSGAWNVALNWDGNVTQPDQGDDLVFPQGASITLRNMSNNLAATRAEFNRLWFGGGEILPWILNGDAFKLFDGIVATNESLLGLVQLRCAAIQLLGSQTWSATNVHLDIAAPVLLGSNTLTMEVEPEDSANFEGGLLGPGTLLLRSGNVEMSPGAIVSNAAVHIDGGVFNAGDVQAFGPEWQMSGGELSFHFARIPGLHADGGRVKFLGGAQAEIEGDFRLGPGCTIVALFENAADQPFVVSGQVNLNGAQLLAGPTSLSLLGATLTLIKNIGTKPVIGTFDGLPEGAVLAVTDDNSGLSFASRISYVGGSGHDVTLTPLSGAARLTSVQRFANGDVELQGFGVAGALVKIEASTDLATFTQIGTVTVDAAGKFLFVDHAGALSKRFYRAFTP